MIWFWRGVGFAGLGMLALVAWISLRVAISSARHPAPQGVVMLTGHPQRITVALDLLEQDPDLRLIVVGGCWHIENYQRAFQRRAPGLKHLHFEAQALDTLTSFTSILPYLRAQKLQHIYVVTSQAHMPRTQQISWWILGSQGRVITPVPASDQIRPEHPSRRFRDTARALIWLLTRQTGDRFNPRYQQCLEYRKSSHQ
ncbi:MAG: YdcF family protein [Cyanobacteria bacterium P01_H01_bin.15]